MTKKKKKKKDRQRESLIMNLFQHVHSWEHNVPVLLKKKKKN